MKVSEAVDTLAEGFAGMPPARKTQLAVTFAVACLTARSLPLVPGAICSMLAGMAAKNVHVMLADMRDLTLKQAAYLDALHAKAISDAAGGV